MDAKQKLLEYAEEIKTKSNTGLQGHSGEWIMGKAMVEGVCFQRTPSTRTSAFVRRENKTIIVIERTNAEVMHVIDGRGVFEDVVTETEIFRVDLS
jgi:hypothetical protein